MTILLFITYQIVQITLLPIIALFIARRKMQSKPVFGNFYERIGLVPKAPTTDVTWFHAVSVGEVLSIQYAIEKMKRSQPTAVCYLTVGTLTGKKIAQEKSIGDIVSFLPYDFLLPMLLAFHRIRPRKIILVEAELWPNFLFLAHVKKIPLYLINARLSTRRSSFLFFKKIFLKKLYCLFTTIFTQSERDTQALINLGLHPKRLRTLGNIKTYNVFEKKRMTTRITEKSKTLLVGSLHPGELDTYLHLYRALRQEHPTLKMILAPRHFHWKNELIENVARTGYRYNVWDEASVRCPNDYDILLVCKLGELFSLYQHASVYCLGGTFVPIGGHNLLEPAAWGSPTIVGPYFFNSKAIAGDLLQRNALRIAQNEKALYQLASAFLKDHILSQAVGNNARIWLEQQSFLVEKKLTSFFSL